MAPTRTRPLGQIQLLRAAAALSVVFFHIQGALRNHGLFDPFPDLAVGAFGVDLFFVISGFIMVYATRTEFGKPGSARLFLWNRIARIGPPYWLVTTFFVLTNVFVRSPDNPGYSSAYIISSYLFMPHPRFTGEMLPVFPLGWTLNYEMLFYVVFAAAMTQKRAVGVWLAAAALVGLVFLGLSFALPAPLSYWASPIVLEFLFGMVVGELYLRGLRFPPAGAFALVCLGCATVLAFRVAVEPADIARGLGWGLGATAIVAGAVLRAPMVGSPISRALGRLGDASYSLYLVHPIAFLFVRNAVLRLGAWDHIAGIWVYAYAALLLLSSIAAALLMWWIFERPITRALRRKKRAPPTSDGSLHQLGQARNA
jgi:exopolysaccharide production protein ExoZ